MHALLQVARKYPPTLILHLYADNRRLEVLVLHLPQELLETQFIYSQDVADAGNQTATVLSESQWYVLAGGGVDELEFGAVIDEAVGLDEADRAGTRRELDVQARAQDQEGVVALFATQGRTDEM